MADRRARTVLLSASTALVVALGVVVLPSAARAEGLDYARIVINPTGGSYPGSGGDYGDAGMVGDRLYVWAYGTPTDRRLWAIDGTAASEVAPDHEFAGGNRAVIFRDRVIFQANAPGVGVNDKHIWEYDGTNLRDLGDNGISGIGGTLELNGLLYEGDYDGLFVYDGLSFQQLSSEHVRDSDLRIAPDGQTLVYVTDEAVRAYDGSSFSTLYTGDSPQFPMVTASHVFFQDSGVLYAYDWATQTTSTTYIGNTNGGPSTPDGVYLSVEGVATYCIPGSCQPLAGPGLGAYSFTEAGSHVYFRAPDPSGDVQLWAVRSGESRAAPVSINPSGASEPFGLMSFNDQLFLSADGGDGSHLWQVNGTSARLLAKPNPGGGSQPDALAASQDSVYFSASDGSVRDLFVIHPFAPPPDETPPVVTISTPTDGMAVAQGEILTSQYLCTDDEGSGIASCSGSLPSAADLDTTTLGSHTFTVAATDNAGNSASASVTYWVVEQGTSTETSDPDTVPDSVEQLAPNSGDGNNDGTPDAAQANVASLPLLGAAMGGETTYVSVASPEGTTLSNVYTMDPTDTSQVTTPPPSGVALPQGLTNFVVNGVLPGSSQTVSIYVSSTEGIVGYAKYDPSTGQWSTLPDDRVTIYPDRVDITLTDGGIGDADGTANGSIDDPGAPFANAYEFEGFLQPVNDEALTPGVTRSVFKAGSTVPVKFRLLNLDGTVAQPATDPTWLAPTKGARLSTSTNEQIWTMPASSGVDFEQTGDTWHYNWKTQGMEPGYWYRIGVKLDNGATQYVVVGLR